MAYLYDYNAKFGDQVIHAGDKLLVTYNVESKNTNIPGHDSVAPEKDELSIDVYEDAPTGGSLNLIDTIRIRPASNTFISAPQTKNLLVYDNRYLIVGLPTLGVSYVGIHMGAIFVYDLEELAQSQSPDGLGTYPKVAIYNPTDEWTLGGSIKFVSENGVQKLATTLNERPSGSGELHIIDIQELLSMAPSTYGDTAFSYGTLNNTAVIPYPSGRGVSDGLSHVESTETNRVTMSSGNEKFVYEYNTSTGSWGTSPSSSVDLLSEGYTDGSQWNELTVSDDTTIREMSTSITVFDEYKKAIILDGSAGGQYPSDNNTKIKHMSSVFDISSATKPVHIVGQNPIPDISLVSGPPSTNPTLVNLGIGKVAGVYWNFYSDGTWRVWTYKSSTGTEDRLEYYGNWLSGPMNNGETYHLYCHAIEINGEPFNIVQTNGDGQLILEGDNENALVPGVTLAGSGVRPSYMFGWNHVSRSEVAAGHLKFTETDPSLNQNYSGYAIIKYYVDGPPTMLPSENSFRFDYTLADSV